MSIEQQHFHGQHKPADCTDKLAEVVHLLDFKSVGLAKKQNKLFWMGQCIIAIFPQDSDGINKCVLCYLIPFENVLLYNTLIQSN